MTPHSLDERDQVAQVEEGVGGRQEGLHAPADAGVIFLQEFQNFKFNVENKETNKFDS